MCVKSSARQSPNSYNNRHATHTTLARQDENASTFVLFHQYNFVRFATFCWFFRSNRHCRRTTKQSCSTFLYIFTSNSTCSIVHFVGINTVVSVFGNQSFIPHMSKFNKAFRARIVATVTAIAIADVICVNVVVCTTRINRCCV